MKNTMSHIISIIFICSILLSCGNQYEETINYARALDDNQLIALFDEMEFHWRRIDETPIDGLRKFPNNSLIPNILAELSGPQVVNPRRAFIILKPSIDEDVRLLFIGLAEEESPTQYQAIELHYYDGPHAPRSEVLWEQGQSQ